MKKNNMLLVLPLLACLVGCNNQQPQPTTEPSGDEQTTTVETTSIEETTSEEEVQPTISIEDGDRQVYITKQLGLSAAAENTEDQIVWASGDTAIATVDGGVVTGVAPGKVTITASLANNSEIKDEVEIEVLDTIIDAEVNAAAWNFEKLYQNDPEIVVKAAESNNTNDIKTYAAFKNINGKQYVAQAHFDVKSVGDWVWNTLTIGHINGDGQIYATGFSQGTKKIITQFSKTVGGVEQLWGPISDRSQVWNQHDLESLDVSNGVDIMSVRDGGDFYFFINNELYWKETSTFNDYDEIDTQPVIYLNGVEASVSGLIAFDDAEEVKDIVESAAAQRKLYPTFSAHVEINEADNQVKFKNVDSVTTNNKDIAAKSIGDAMLFPANKESKIEFDLVIDQWGSQDATPVVSVDMKRYDSSTAETRSFLMGQNSVSFAGWDYNNNMPAGYPAGPTNYNDGEKDIKMAEEKTYHVVCTRLMLDGGQDTKLQVFDGEKVIVTAQHGWQDGYKGNAVIFLSVRNVAATLSNIAITVTE